MPAQSKAQRRFFALALQYKKGELKSSDVSDEVKELSKLPVKTLEDFVKTDDGHEWTLDSNVIELKGDE